MGKYAVFLLLAALASLLPGCTPLYRSEQNIRSESILFIEGSPIGQAFLAKYDGLEGFAIFIKNKEAGSGEVILELSDSPKSSTYLRTASYSLAELPSQGYYQFSFDPAENSSLQSYFISLKIAGQGGFLIGTGPGNSYLNGAIYENGAPQNAQLAFRLVYEPGRMLVGLVKEALSWTAWVLVFLFLFLLPGWAILRSLCPKPAHSWLDSVGLSAGIGFAIYPLLFLWLDLVKIKISLPLLLSIPALSAAWLSHSAIRSIQSNWSRGNSTRSILRTWFQTQDWPRNLAFLLLLGTVAFTRFWPVRALDAPMWGDSYQHTLITRLLVDHQGLFRSWEPYAESLSFTYHFGFHTLVAGFHQLTNMDLFKAVLWIGQMVNLAAVLALVPLASKVGEIRWSGIFAVLVAGLLSPMPMVYVNWGRYTQLAGQAILPAAIWLIWSAGELRHGGLRTSLLASIILSGLFLTHYRVMVFVLSFYLVMLLVNLRKPQWLDLVKKYSVQGISAFLVSLPWVLRLFEGKLPSILGEQLATTSGQVPENILELNAVGDVTGYLPLYLWLLVLGAFLIGLVRRRRPTLIIALWWLIIFLAANPHLVGLPGTGALSNFAVFIAAYIPAGLIIGAAAGGLLEKNQPPDYGARGLPSFASNSRNTRNFLRSGLLLSIVLVSFVIVGLTAAPARLRDIKIDEHALVTRPDIEAGSWIRENVSEGSKFLVNSFVAYQDSLVVGSDAGWWLPLIAGRKTTQPPINYVTEREPWSGYIAETNELVREISREGIDHPDVIRELQERKVTHVYIGQQQGTVNGSPLLDARAMLNNPIFRLIYHENRVWIFEIGSLE